MTNNLNFKLYDPLAQLIASGGGLPLIGGTLTGNLTLTSPAKVVQSQPPVNPIDLTNKAYVDGLIGGGPFLPLTGGAMTGAITQPIAPVAANDVSNKAYVDSKNPISLFGGTDPNSTSPTDRPSTNGVLYMGTDNLLWVWNGSTYDALTPSKLVTGSKTLANQTMVVNDFVSFAPLIDSRLSTQGLTIVNDVTNSEFSIDLEVDRKPVLVKITVCISGLYTPGVIAKFFTYNITAAAYTSGPGLILNNGNATQITSTHIYSEIVNITPGTTTLVGVQLRNITGGASIDIGNGGGVPLPYRWILFEEV